MIEALRTHVALNVADLDASIDFYRKLFGAAPVRVRADYAKFDIPSPPLNLALNLRIGTLPTNHHNSCTLSHLGIQVRSTADVLALREDWLSRGLLTRDEMNTNCCYATQDKTWATDPDGNEWEVFVVLNDSPEAAATATTKTCCVS